MKLTPSTPPPQPEYPIFRCQSIHCSRTNSGNRIGYSKLLQGVSFQKSILFEDEKQNQNQWWLQQEIPNQAQSKSANSGGISKLTIQSQANNLRDHSTVKLRKSSLLVILLSSEVPKYIFGFTNCPVLLVCTEKVLRRMKIFNVIAFLILSATITKVLTRCKKF